MCALLFRLSLPLVDVLSQRIEEGQVFGPDIMFWCSSCRRLHDFLGKGEKKVNQPKISLKPPLEIGSAKKNPHCEQKRVFQEALNRAVEKIVELK